MHRRAALDLNDTETKMTVRTPRDPPESFIPWIARLQYSLHRRQRRGAAPFAGGRGNDLWVCHRTDRGGAEEAWEM